MSDTLFWAAEAPDFVTYFVGTSGRGCPSAGLVLARDQLTRHPSFPSA